jgi:DNA repair protein RecN (Recombination protein N)
LTEQANDLAAQLSELRRRAARKLAPLIEPQLAELGMEKATFAIDFRVTAEADASGADAVEFVVQTNPGLPAQPLRKIASGGELSRVMLALKGVLASAGDRVSVLVFDEIDANVGGRLGAVIGGKLRQLAKLHQVLCITHLPQIACYADRHLTVRKEAAGGKTTTTVRVVSGEDRVREIAEMIGGQRVTQTTIAQARELLSAACDAPIKRATTPARRPAARKAS